MTPDYQKEVEHLLKKVIITKGGQRGNNEYLKMSSHSVRALVEEAFAAGVEAEREKFINHLRVLTSYVAIETKEDVVIKINEIIDDLSPSPDKRV